MSNAYLALRRHHDWLWIGIKANLKDEKRWFAPLAEFVSFVVTEANVAYDPVNSCQRQGEDEVIASKRKGDI